MAQSARHRLAELLLRLGRPEASLVWAEEAVHADPLAETGHRLIISAHLARSDRGAAEAALERCTRLLRDRLGVEPSDETRALLDRGLRR